MQREKNRPGCGQEPEPGRLGQAATGIQRGWVSSAAGGGPSWLRSDHKEAGLLF